MLGHTKGNRSAVTCALKCNNACAHEVCNTSGNSYFRDVASAGFSRRSMLGVGGVGALALMLGGAAAGGAAPAAAGTAGGLAPAAKAFGNRSRLQFTGIKAVAKTVDDVTVPRGYTWEPIIRWGDPLFKDSVEFDPENQTPQSQAGQFGYNNDYLDIIEIPGSRGKRAVLFSNHEYTNEPIMFPATMSASDVRKTAMAAHGLTVVELERRGKGQPWKYVRGAKLNRRFLIDTEYELTGPAAGSDLLKTKADATGRKVLGTLNNCAGGTTPWGTVLSGEENFNQYFKAASPTAEQRRYGITDANPSRGWHQEEVRFDLGTEDGRNEENRFGWIVEVDPFDPTSTPRKHTALGRFKHEGANVIIAESGHAVAYSGDDERFDYLYKFVSKGKYVEGDKTHNMTLLTEGDLYVAKFVGDAPKNQIDGSGTLPSDGGFDGVGMWLPLVQNGASMVEGMSVEQVLVYTRLAADKAGGTKMDRPEDVEINPRTGKVYMACTNNTNRAKGTNPGVDEANPRKENKNGHVIEIDELGEQDSLAFTWNILLMAGDPAVDKNVYFAGYPADEVQPISCPDNLAFDAAGNLWISTDGQPGTIGRNDGLFRVTLEGPQRGKLEQFMAVPAEAETCGPLIHDEDGLVFVAVQHPGEDGKWDAQTSMFPDYVKAGSKPGKGKAALPRPSVIQMYKG
ncbi:PhoX family phosphatase [Arthrobacter sp. I2-34]|uniref:PhoX family phosphatase n=1 Tax=Arthrobacter hankyongi TaxID=2904801 RepID=A0ABS9LAG2_9MICC|nr:PhoX family phosphatase [Arthrobacter hankyongi]MCG2623467.1 PhoX family phosphatase [Arthrobacter hankyongi]